MTLNRDTEALAVFGKHLRDLRKNKGLTQYQLAADAGVDRNQIGNIERGERNPSLSTLIALAKALDISLSELVSFK